MATTTEHSTAKAQTDRQSDRQAEAEAVADNNSIEFCRGRNLLTSPDYHTTPSGFYTQLRVRPGKKRKRRRQVKVLFSYHTQSKNDRRSAQTLRALTLSLYCLISCSHLRAQTKHRSKPTKIVPLSPSQTLCGPSTTTQFGSAIRALSRKLMS